MRKTLVAALAVATAAGFASIGAAVGGGQTAHGYTFCIGANGQQYGFTSGCTGGGTSVGIGGDGLQSKSSAPSSTSVGVGGKHTRSQASGGSSTSVGINCNAHATGARSNEVCPTFPMP